MVGFGVVIAPLMHGAAQWGTINGLINGRTTVLTPKFDAHDVWRAVEKYKIPTLSITGDAMGRPLIEALDEGGYDASSLVAVASTAAVFSATVKAQFHERFPNLIIADAVGSTETGYNGVRVIMKGGEEKPGLPTVKMGPDTVVLDDDMNIVQPGSGIVGRMARGGNVPLRYHKDPEKSAATFVMVNGRRFSVSGDSAVVEADGTMTLLGRGLGVHQLRRREDLSRRGRGRVEGPRSGVRRRRGRRARRTLGRAGRRGRRDAARPLGDTRRARRARARRSSRATRCRGSCTSSTKIERSPSGKPDYRWAKDIATGVKKG